MHRFVRRLGVLFDVTDSDCWIPKNRPQPNGYVKINRRGQSCLLHRLMYEEFIGPAGSDLDVCHKCDVRACGNPSHLFLGTRLDNMRDAAAKGRTAYGFKLPQTVLSNDDRAEIIALAESGMTYPNIAAKFGITRQHASEVARRVPRAVGVRPKDAPTSR